MSVPCQYPSPDHYHDLIEPPEEYGHWRDPSGNCTHPYCIEADSIRRLHRWANQRPLLTDEYARHYERTGFDPDGLYGAAACGKAGHVDGCPGKAGGEHELWPGWISYEDEQGFTIEVEVSGA